jgi:uncharacterized protein
MSDVIEKAEARVKALLTGESTGHDWYHIQQVRDMALRIAKTEGGDKELIELAALVHDVGDHKLHASKEAGELVTREVLRVAGASRDLSEKVMEIVSTMSFSTGKIPESLEGRIVQDADRLYALGAIGIARAFAYGGKKERLIYDPEKPQDYSTTIGHFYEKLLTLKDKLNTASARTIAQNRHEFMEGFLKQFYKEWQAKD